MKHITDYNTQGYTIHKIEAFTVQRVIKLSTGFYYRFKRLKPAYLDSEDSILDRFISRRSMLGGVTF